MNTRSLMRRALSLLVAVAFIAPSFPVAMPSVATADPVVLGNITVTSAGQTFTVPGSSLVTSGSVVATAVTAWVNTIGGKVDKKSVDATLKLNKKKRRLDFKASVKGYKLDRAVATQQITDELNAELSATASSTVVALKTTVLNPKVTKFGKTILVVQSRRKIYLYDNKKVIKTYRCAVGQPRWPTPNGTFHIGKKVKNPSWTNGYASWSKNMPAYIGPGPNNPLGTRAMYVYTGATSGGHDIGVRFHGVPHSEDGSIGHAASHGCLRMHRKDVENFFPRVSVGTTVYIIK